MPSDFPFIIQYQTRAKDLENETSIMMPDLDQEVPQSIFSSHYLEDIKPQIKVEETEVQPGQYNMMDSLVNSTSPITGSTLDLTANRSCNYSTIRHKNVSVDTFSQMKSSPASVLSSTTPSFFSSPLSTISSSSSVSLSSLSSLSACSASSSLRPSPGFYSTKASSFPSENGGYFVLPDFLTDNTNQAPVVEAPEDSAHYIDLDTLHIPSYEPVSSSECPGVTSCEPSSVPLEEAAFIMRDTIHRDCDLLNIPYDPLIWNAEHVRKWVFWVCHRNRVPDVSAQFCHFDGRMLCSLSSDNFHVAYGQSGIKISDELELMKAANSCFPNQNCSSNSYNLPSYHHQLHLYNPFMEELKTSDVTPSVSPTPSSCSSNHDSNNSIMSTHSDPSDDDAVYGYQNSGVTSKIKFGNVNGIVQKNPAGRGHKQTIHLWEFLKELLLSKDIHNDCIRWLDRKTGIFKIEDSKKVAMLWGARKNRPAMNYDKLSRSVRQYYKKGIIKKTEQSKRLVYQFCAGYM